MAEPTSSDPGGDLARVRQALVRGLESVTTFEGMARQSSHPEARAGLERLAQRAKEDVAALTRLLCGLDPEQEAAFAAAGARPSSAPQAPGSPTGGGSRPASAPIDDLRLPDDPQRLLYALPAPPSPRAGQLTVGPLKGKKF